MLTMPASDERIMRRMGAAEMERRWALLRRQMDDIGVPVVVTLCSDDFLGGYTRWLSDRPATNAYHAVAMFHADAPMTLIEHGSIGGHRLVGNHPDFVGTEEVFTTTSWRSVPSTHRNEAVIVSQVLQKRGYRRVGIIGGGAMPYAFLKELETSGVEIVDVTDLVDRCKAIKSPAEILEIEATAAMQDAIFATLLDQISPGMRDLDVMALAQCEGHKRGSEQGVFLVQSQSPGSPTLLAPPHFQGRTIRPGDHITILIENNGPAGYYTELGRTVVLGSASSELLDATDLAVDAQQNTLARLRPGAVCADIARAHDVFLEAHGLDPETRLYAHGQGYDLVERPLIRADDSSVVEAGMNIVVHPSFVAAGAFGYVCDNFIVEPNGPPRALHNTEQRVFEI